jgi:sterol desaturase/sphingolipid hydroxylase (fatty acid hydroxylase superfamily)
MILKLSILSVVIASVIMLVEFILDQKEQKHLYKKNDTLNNFLIGVPLFAISFLNKVVNYPAFLFVYSIRIFSFENTFLTCILAFIVWDFSYYWYHRASHGVNWLWASHSVHHSSEQYNLSTAFRQSWVQNLSGGFLFKLVLPLLGFDPMVVFMVDVIGMGYQSWLHSDMIGRLHPSFEFLFNSPSHHRVHHASDLKYLDKNHGGVFIIWDRVFGTYKEEEEKPAYGLTTNLSSQKVQNIMWNYWRYLLRRVLSCRSLIVGIKYLFASPGWSHDGSTVTVKQMRSAQAEHKCAACKNLNCARRLQV